MSRLIVPLTIKASSAQSKINFQTIPTNTVFYLSVKCDASTRKPKDVTVSEKSWTSKSFGMKKYEPIEAPLNFG